MKPPEAMETIESHVDHQKVERAKDSRKDIDNKVAKILKLIKNNGQDKKGKVPEDSKKRTELVRLIEDIHKQYQSLFAQYDHLRGEKPKKARGKKGKKVSSKDSSSSSSSSGSDSEYYSPEEKGNLHANERHVEANITKEKPETVSSEAAGVKHKVFSMISEKESLSENPEAMDKVQQKSEPSTLVKVQELHGSQTSGQIKELEGQLVTLRIEMESLRLLNKDLQVQAENKALEANQIGELNLQLQAKITELDLVAKEKADQISATNKKMKENEKKLASRIEDLMGQVTNLQVEVDSSNDAKSKLVSERNQVLDQIKGLNDRIVIMRQEMDSICGQKIELESQLEMRTKEVRENVVQIQTLNDEVARRTQFEGGWLKEKEGFLVKNEELKLQLQAVGNKNAQLEELVRNKNKETDILREEKQGLDGRISELEGTLTERVDELSHVQKKYVCDAREASAEITALKSQVNSLQEKLDLLLGEKRMLEMQNEKLKLDYEEKQIEVESEIHNLTNKIAEQNRILKEREETIKKLSEEPKLVKHLSLDSPKFRTLDSARINQQTLERKMEELAEKFQMKMENHIRLLYQRILVAEQIHAETKDSYKKIKEMLEQEKEDLNEKLVMFEAGLRNFKDLFLEPGYSASIGVDMVPKNIDDKNAEPLNRIGCILSEIQSAGNWIADKNSEIKALKDNVDSLASQLGQKEANELLLSEKLQNLEECHGKEIEEVKQKAYSQYERKVGNLEQQLKEKEEILLGLGEEKREAIRHLCVLIEYHRSRYDEIKMIVSKMPIKTRRPA